MPDDFMDQFIEMFEEATGEDGQELKRLIEESEKEEARIMESIRKFEEASGKPFIEYREDV
jgi:hypothetical protein